MRKRVIGFNAYNNEPEAKDEKNTDRDCVMYALETWSRAFPPARKDDGYGVTYLTSREIKESLADMVTTTISTITEFLMERDYRMVFTDGGKVAWEVADLMTKSE